MRNIFLLGFLLLFSFAACRKVESESSPLAALSSSRVLPGEQRALMDQAKSFLAEDEPHKALRCLEQCGDGRAYPMEYERLLMDVEVAMFKQEIKLAQERTVKKAIAEVDRGLVLPETYGKTLPMDGEVIDNFTPSGPMEDLVNRKVSMDLQDAGIQEVVMALSEIVGLNIIADSALNSEQQLTVKVKDVPLRELLSYVARNLGIAFHLGESVIWVTATDSEPDSGPALETRIFKLRSGVIPFVDGGTGADFFSGVGGEGSGGVSELDDALQTFLDASHPEAAYRIYRNRNLLVVRNTRENLRVIESLVELLDREIQQVLIEARFVTISQSDLFELGYNLAEIGPTNPARETEVMEIENNLLRNFPADGNLTLSGVIGNYEYEMVIHALNEMSSSRTISAPRITVLNNQYAVLRRGDTLRYFEEYELETVPNEGGVAVSQPVPVGSVQEIDLGITLEVRPTISHDGRKVMLSLRPEIIQFLGFDEFITARLPRTNDNSLETVVVVRSGQTVVLGGMITETKEEGVNRIPLLGDLPLVGHFFSHSNRSEMPSHLLIFVTAKILDSSGAYVEVL